LVTFLLINIRRVATVRDKLGKNKILLKVREKAESSVPSQGISPSQFEVSEKSGSFFLRLPQEIFFFIDKAILFYELSEHFYFKELVKPSN